MYRALLALIWSHASGQYNFPFSSVFCFHQLFQEILGALAAKCYTVLTS